MSDFNSFMSNISRGCLPTPAQRAFRPGGRLPAPSHVAPATALLFFICVVCGKQFMGDWLLHESILAQNIPGTSSCPHVHCNFTTERHDLLSLHLRHSHPILDRNTEQLFTCQGCTQRSPIVTKFHRNALLCDHDNPLPRYRCPNSELCLFSSRTELNVTNHQETCLYAPPPYLQLPRQCLNFPLLL